MGTGVERELKHRGHCGWLLWEWGSRKEHRTKERKKNNNKKKIEPVSGWK
jgi:hypothetical protein